MDCDTDCLGNSCSVAILAQVSCTHATSSVEAMLVAGRPAATMQNSNAPPSACRHSTSLSVTLLPMPGEAGAAFPKLVQG